MKKLIIVSILLFSFALLADEYLVVPELNEKEVKILSSFNYELLESKIPYFVGLNDDMRFIFSRIRLKKFLSNDDKNKIQFLCRLYGLEEDASLLEIYFSQLRLLKARIFILNRIVALKIKMVPSLCGLEEHIFYIKRYKRLIKEFNRLSEALKELNKSR